MTAFSSMNATGFALEKNSARIGAVVADLLTLTALVCAALGLWRFAVDLDWAGDFVIGNGLLSHWQIWLGAAFSVQYASLRLGRGADPKSEPSGFESGVKLGPAAQQRTAR